MKSLATASAAGARIGAGADTVTSVAVPVSSPRPAVYRR
ncbi:hypothetical protein BZL30_4372 [Mycobacterium kansasii]|uniref:Uncharacterized protein n=1 Tax=Mycobacterium kansasii TaxID=1768 RepID=A0A1V3X2Q6_MYCKA|nr:hypothetical protein BZL30_4372 [Mycobacterium kansasii]